MCAMDGLTWEVLNITCRMFSYERNTGRLYFARLWMCLFIVI